MSKIETQVFAELVKRKIFDEQRLRQELKQIEGGKYPFFYSLVDKKILQEDILLEIISDITGIKTINLKETAIEKEAIDAVPVRFCWYYEFMPVKLENKKLTVAIATHFPIAVQDEIRLNLGYTLKLRLAKRSHILELLKHHYGLGAETVERMNVHDTDSVTELGESAQEIEDIEKLAEDASVIKLVNQILLDAYQKRATDIHIEPYRAKVRVRYRIDGVLFDQTVPEGLNRFLLPIFSRIKIMANLNIVEHRMPQDGRALVKTQDQILDLRVSFIPTPHGESLVIRVLPTQMLMNLENLGLVASDLTRVRNAIMKPSGIIFVTGPTGSGKTTTLYAALKEINKKEKKIITIEDPIEYEMEAITQIQVNPDVGLTFAMGLRSMLRHDPDIMMVGEVRDRETADIAIRVALTGHLVLSTLHTNDAATGVSRLIDIGVEPYLVATSVNLFIAQRLVRRICPYCKTQEMKIDPQIERCIYEVLKLGKEQALSLYHGVGCEKCNRTGFFGRTGIYEMLTVDNDIQRLIVEKAPASTIKDKAIDRGMKTLADDGWLKAVNGETTAQEIINVCSDIPQFTYQEKKEVIRLREKDSAKILPPRPTISHDEKRIFMRVPKTIVIAVRLVDKGEGDILKINRKNKYADYSSVFSQDIFERELLEKIDIVDFGNMYTTTVNLSAGGAVFESEYLIPVKSVLEIKMTLPHDNHSIQGFSRVVRVEKNLPHCFYVAICFLDLSGIDRNRIEALVQREVSHQEIVSLDNEQEEY